MNAVRRRRVLFLIATAELLSVSVWFSGTAVLPQLARLWETRPEQLAWVTTAVQLGFVAGALLSAVFNLSDVFRTTTVFVVASLGAAAANAGFGLAAETNLTAALALRFLTGAFLAGVYPPGMKILAGWYRDGRGLALGILVGALTVGKALPYAVEALGELPWRTVVFATSGFAVLAALLVAAGVREGPHSAPQAPVDFRQVGEILRNRPLRLANFGYLGHMWELYAMWSWVGVLLAASAGHDSAGISLAAFFAIAAGGIGCVWAGRASDAAAPSRPEVSGAVGQRARVTIVAMSASGACCLLAALVFHNFYLLAAVCIVWGVAVVADSAQFSTIVSEVADRRYVGTALTLQTALGFLLTAVSIRVMAWVAAELGWRWALAALALGPALGIAAMLPLLRARSALSPEEKSGTIG